MQSRHFLSVRHNPTSYRLLFAWLAFLASTVALADEPGPRKVVALDHSTADLLRACFPAIEFEVLVQFENEPSATINRRAWSTRDADVLVFRSDQISIRSQLFRERLMTQGIRTVDLKAHISIKRALQLRLDADRPNFLRPNVKRLVATHLPATSHQLTDTPAVQTFSALQNKIPILQRCRATEQCLPAMCNCNGIPTTGNGKGFHEGHQ